MKLCLAAILLFVAATPCIAEDASKISTEGLIYRLTQVDQNTPGIDDSGEYDAFLAEDTTPQFESGLLPTKPPTVPPAMQEIVRRGASALPALINHLGDRRMTKFKVGLEYEEGFGGQFYADEYDPRIGVPCVPVECQTDEDKKYWYIQNSCNTSCPNFHGKYTVTVGGVCEVLVGQIVNRRLSAVRYQPTNILYVNSSIVQPSIAERIKKDWGGIDAAGLEAALLEDVRSHPERFVNGALRRLRFYYPKTYASLTGDDLKKRNAFEAEEKEEAARH